jgi:hypothetical protein
VTSRKLRYSERRRLAETGTLGELAHETVPETLRNALWYFIHQPEGRGRTRLLKALDLECRKHFGWSGKQSLTTFLMGSPVDDFLDFTEIFIEHANRRWNDTPYTTPASSDGWRIVVAKAEDRVNELFERHRFGYRITTGEVHKIGSPLLEEEVIGPTLLAVARPGWDQVERSFHEALEHQRGGETDDALTAAHAAVEAALKAVGMSGQFGAMTKQFRNSPFVPAYLRATPDALDALLTLLDRSNAIRSSAGDAHGKESGADEVPQALADLAIHWAGAFIVYLAETTAAG